MNQTRKRKQFLRDCREVLEWLQETYREPNKQPSFDAIKREFEATQHTTNKMVRYLVDRGHLVITGRGHYANWSINPDSAVDINDYDYWG